MTSHRSRPFLTLLSSCADSVDDVAAEHTRTGFFDELALGQLGPMRRNYAVGAGIFLAAGVAIGGLSDRAAIAASAGVIALVGGAAIAVFTSPRSWRTGV